ncbi:MAG: aminoacyl-tRNA hydrolase [Candidatus Omnitrophica bacterium]|nr:aminoacyl-tRNA hydrolase [Candidatus Omnitrophota bacterium]
MKILAGLGNPGFRYRNTRHNVGFMVLKELSRRHRISIRKKGYGGIYGIGRISGEEVMLFEPLTFMNRSGPAVKAALSAGTGSVEDLLVISDDLDLDLGVIRLRGKGSAGGHNGLRSVISLLGSDFNRLRVGIGCGNGPVDASAFVLGRFTRRERPALEDAVREASDCAETWVARGVTEAMNRFN